MLAQVKAPKQSIQFQYGVSFPPSVDSFARNGKKEWLYTEAQWKELYNTIINVRDKDRTTIAKYYNTSIPTIRKYSGNSKAKSTKHQGFKPGNKAAAKKVVVSENPTTPVLADGQDTLRLPFKPLNITTNNVLSRLETKIADKQAEAIALQREADAKYEEVTLLEDMLKKVVDIDVDLLKVLLR